MNYFEVFMQIRQWIRFFFLKKCHPPPPCRFAWKLEGRLTKFTIRVFRSSILSEEIFVSFWKFQLSLRKSTKFVFEFCGLDPIGRLALVDTATLSFFNHDCLRVSAQAPCSFIRTILSRKNFFQKFALKKKSVGNSFTHSLDQNYHANFSVEIPSWVRF
jgi:hypothetical protein